MTILSGICHWPSYCSLSVPPSNARTAAEEEMADKQADGITDDQGSRSKRQTTTETASGAEATQGMQGKPEGESHKHRSAYGGDGGEPKEPDDFPHSRR